MLLHVVGLRELTLPELLRKTEGREMEKTDLPGKQPRRKFLARLMASIAGATALAWLPKKARAEAKKPQAQDTGPILYHRTEETERYYRTLYR